MAAAVPLVPWCTWQLLQITAAGRAGSGCQRSPPSAAAQLPTWRSVLIEWLDAAAVSCPPQRLPTAELQLPCCCCCYRPPPNKTNWLLRLLRRLRRLRLLVGSCSGPSSRLRPGAALTPAATCSPQFSLARLSASAAFTAHGERRPPCGTGVPLRSAQLREVLLRQRPRKHRQHSAADAGNGCCCCCCRWWLQLHGVCAATAVCRLRLLRFLAWQLSLRQQHAAMLLAVPC